MVALISHLLSFLEAPRLCRANRLMIHHSGGSLDREMNSQSFIFALNFALQDYLGRPRTPETSNVANSHAVVRCNLINSNRTKCRREC